ncbi:extracellular solute-binding protein [Paenibacillus puerhi]|uniref:extracellular solute-binding protein n=1 Tax=Paenibacillus puerhi TaxID=2692622 RepID=UPI00135917BF|nr:extracellular solute-binding protein [Paenibacillus puerhi]
MKRKMKVVTVICVASLLMVMVAGCGKGNVQNDGGQGTAAPGDNASVSSKEPLKLSMLNILYDPEAPKADNPIIGELEKRTNTKLEITWTPDKTYSDKLNVTIASGTLPDIIMVDNPGMASIVNSVRSGMFWEIGPYLKDYPNLAKLNPNILNNISVDGKLYGIYRQRDLTQGSINFRKDWLDNLGLKEPKTMDDLYQIIKAFTLDDPDKNGKNDTIGLTEDKNLAVSFREIATYLGGPNKWEVKDGKLSPDFMSPAFMETMKFYKRLYDEKLMNLDFPTLNQKRDNFAKGKAGVIFEKPGSTIAVMEDLVKIDPKAQLDFVGGLTGPQGDRRYAGNGYFGVFMFPKTSLKTEQQLKQALGFMDKLLTPENQTLLFTGIEGRDFTVENGKAIMNTNQAKADNLTTLSQLQLSTDAAIPKNVDDIIMKASKLTKENEKFAVYDPAAAFISETKTSKGDDLQKIIEDARIKFILGSIDEAGFKKELDRWMTSGGSKVIDEMTAQYNQMKK